MYVRTIKGKIFDCFESEQMGKPIFYPKKSNTNGYIDYTEVYKKSNNIIDICEVEDYVNGLPVRFVEENRIDIGQAEDYLWLKNEHIKSIVTKEMFSNVEYRVENN